MKYYHKRSFTLIELLVVIAIIGGLSALLVPNYMGARERALDTKRKSDLKQIQMYKQDQNPPAYPTELPSANQCWSSGVNCTGNIYMNKFPSDPTPEKNYYYSVDNNSLTYTLCACLENIADPDKTTNGACSVCTSCSNGPCYIVNQP